MIDWLVYLAIIYEYKRECIEVPDFKEIQDSNGKVIPLNIFISVHKNYISR